MTDLKEDARPAERIRRLAGRLAGEPEKADLDEAAGALLYMLAELSGLERLLGQATECLTVEEGRHVSFDVDKRGGSAQVRVDDAVRFIIAKARQIEFTYELAAARSADFRSFTLPPMRWAEPE